MAAARSAPTPAVFARPPAGLRNEDIELLSEDLADLLDQGGRRCSGCMFSGRSAAATTALCALLCSSLAF